MARHLKYGIPTALLVGDALHSLSILAISSKSSISDYETLLDVIALLEVASEKICEGQFYDVSLQTGQIEASEESYIKMVECKTACLIQTAAEAGALIGRRDNRIASIFREYGRTLGIGFQIRDDILSVTADEKILGKPVGSDIREGKMSLPVIHFLKNAGASHKEKFMKIFRKSTSSKDIEIVRGLFKHAGSLDYAKSRAQYYANKAYEQLNEMDLNDYYRDLLETFVTFSIEREY